MKQSSRGATPSSTRSPTASETASSRPSAAHPAPPAGPAEHAMASASPSRWRSSRRCASARSDSSSDTSTKHRFPSGSAPHSPSASCCARLSANSAFPENPPPLPTSRRCSTPGSPRQRTFRQRPGSSSAIRVEKPSPPSMPHAGGRLPVPSTSVFRPVRTSTGSFSRPTSTASTSCRTARIISLSIRPENAPRPRTRPRPTFPAFSPGPSRTGTGRARSPRSRTSI
ncbi:MAG: hypothetical protein BWY66_02117 [bacterium ADurb.Bin374]|nr:MAG: hypothetical protein BWY66_02117 [bacterium ADurb.Bin374]